MIRSIAAAAFFFAIGCTRPAESPPAVPARPDLLLVTLDTTRADHVAPESDLTPSLAALAARSLRFSHAYTTAPTTLPAHVSMMTGLYPAGHGVHENGRRLGEGVPVVAERLRELGYATAAFVSGYPLEGRFGLERGFETYDDDFGHGALERRADRTTDLALAWLLRPADRPRFLWVHYYDPHDPYAPPEPFASRFPDDPYRGEIAFVDGEAGRLLEAFERSAHKGGFRLLVVGDHGEGRGDHGEALHGNLLYQGVMRVPMLAAGHGIDPGVREDAVSVRQVRATFLHWAGDEVDGSLSSPSGDPVLGEAMQPFLNYRWQPQAMAVDGRRKLIRSGRFELYDLAADPREERDLAAGGELPRELAKAVADYPLPSPRAAAPPANEEERRRLASLGYLSAGSSPASVPKNAPRAADMTRLFEELDLGSRAFANGDYMAAAARFRTVVRADPGNLMTWVRLGVSQSFLGEDRAALASFASAQRLDPESIEIKSSLALHHLKEGRLREAEPLLEALVATPPDREAALAGLARIRIDQGRFPEAAALLERAVPIAETPAAMLTELGGVRMGMGDTDGAITAFERARAADPRTFRGDLELGVLYLAARRLEEARAALDRVPPDHPAWPMALFKRAQVSVLLGEPDRADRIRAAREAADATTAPLIANERLFAGTAGR